MDLVETLDAEHYIRLDTLLNNIASLHAQDYVRSIGLAASYQRQQYFARFDVLMYRRAQHKWFSEYFKTAVYAIVFPNGPPNTFLPGVQNREQVFCSGLSPSARTLFVAMAIRHLYRCIDEEWQAHGARTSPVALYF